MKPDPFTSVPSSPAESTPEETSLDRRRFLTAVALASAAPFVFAACAKLPAGAPPAGAPTPGASTTNTPAPIATPLPPLPVVAFVPPKGNVGVGIFTGEICMFAGQEPAGWVQCAGQLVPIREYEALFSLLGDTYGGSYPETFALPDLRRATPLGVGPQNQLGKRTELTVAPGGPEGDGSLPGYLAVNFCIAVHAYFPSRP